MIRCVEYNYLCMYCAYRYEKGTLCKFHQKDCGKCPNRGTETWCVCAEEVPLGEEQCPYFKYLGRE